MALEGVLSGHPGHLQVSERSSLRQELGHINISLARDRGA